MLGAASALAADENERGAFHPLIVAGVGAVVHHSVFAASHHFGGIVGIVAEMREVAVASGDGE